MAERDRLTTKQAKVVGGSLAGGSIIAAAVALSLPVTKHWEGRRLTPYHDIGGVLTVCYGETRHVQDRRYTPAECDDMLRKAQATDYAPPILKCVPQLAENRYAFAAMIDAGYNAGVARVCRSPMAAHFRAGRWRQGCEAFKGWVATVRGLMVRGLLNRRAEDQVWSERTLCLKGVP